MAPAAGGPAAGSSHAPAAPISEERPAPAAGGPAAERAEPTDAELLAAVRAGDAAAFEALYARHRAAARRLAGALVRDPADAEDLVHEAVAKVLAMLRAGGGPLEAFRAYLLKTVRHTCYDRSRRDRRIELTEDLTRYESADGDAADPTVARLERTYAARAFARLPERWQLVLWHTEVEGEKPAAIAPMLGVTPNAVAALAYRAREGLRQMYLQEHVATGAAPACHWTANRLGAHVRGGLRDRDRSKVDAHLSACRDCQRLREELAQVNSGLRGVLAPVVLGTAAAPYLATTTTGWWVAAIGWGRSLVEAVHGWVRSLVERYGPGNVAAGAGVAAAALVGAGMFTLAMALGTDDGDTEGDPPAAAEPGLPVPAPGPVSSPAPPDPSPTPPPTPAPAEPPPVAPPADPPDTPGPPPAPGEPIGIAPDLAATALAAGGPGELAVAVRLPSGSRPAALAESTMADQVVLAVGWPEGITLAGAHAGDGWRCLADDAVGAVCHRPIWPGGESRTARIPVRVEPALGGFAPVEVAVTAAGHRADARFRVPVAPGGLRVGYAGSGPYRLAMAGNTWLSCQPRPECLEPEPLDNDLVALAAYLPGYGEPAVPPGLPEAVAASGAELAVPGDAEVAWAGLHWATTSTGGPEAVRVHGPDGGWRPVGAQQVRHGDARPLRQAYADVTELVRTGGGGEWWLAVVDGELPTGREVTAGWSLTVVYAVPGAPRRDLVVFTGPRSLPGPLSADPTAERVEVGLVLWEGDRYLAGDALRLGDTPLGDPENVASSRAAGARECAGGPAPACRWHTFGVDVARYQGTGSRGAVLTLSSRHDRLEVGVLALAVDAPR